MFNKITAFMRSENGGEGSQTAILIAVASVVVLGLLTFAGTKIHAAVTAGGATIDGASGWKYGDGEKLK